jgi:sn-glycerol 3-phosphate transport system substrate-binding protein
MRDLPGTSWKSLRRVRLTRRMVAGALAGGISALAAACSGRGQSGGEGAGSTGFSRLGPEGFRFERPVALTYWKSLEGPRHEAQVKLTEDFNATRSDIKVTLEHVGTYAQAAEKLQVALAGGTPPDVMMLTVDSFMPGFARRGALYPLDDFAKVDKSAGMDRYVPGFLRDGTVNGKLYQLPFARSTPLFYFNRDHLATAGLPNVAPSTWDQVLDLSQRLTLAGVPQPDTTDQSRIAMGIAAYWWPFQSICWAFGGRLSDDQFRPTVTQPETIEALQFLATMIERRIARGYSTSGRFQTAFVQGQTTFLMESTAQLTQIEQQAPFRVGAAFMPARKERAVPGGGSGLSIIASIPAEKREAGWEFIKFMTNTPNTVYWSMATGYMVVRTDALSVPEYRQHLEANPNARVTFDQMAYVRTHDAIVEVPQAPAAIEDALRQVLVERAPVKTVLEELQRKLTVLAQEAQR